MKRRSKKTCRYFGTLSLGLRLGPGPVRLTRARELKKIYSRADHQPMADIVEESVRQLTND
jgi:hypothetical protein